MKIQFFFLILPCVAAFFWLIAYLLFAPKGIAFGKLKRFLLVLSFFLLFTLLSLDDSGRLLVHFTLFKQVCALLLIPSFVAYIKALQGTKPSGVFFTILSVVPYVQLVVGIESVFSIGYENALKILVDSYTFQGPMFPYLENSQMVYYACYTYMFKSFLLADFLMFSIGLMKCAITSSCNIKDVSLFFFKKKKAPLGPVQYLLSLLLFLIIVSALILGKNSYIENVPLAAIGALLIAVLLSLIAFVGTVGHADSRSIPWILRSIKFGADMPESYDVDMDTDYEDSDAVGQDVELQVEENKPDYHESFVGNDESLEMLRSEIAAKLTAVVEGQELFLKHDLTIAWVADKIGVLRDDLADYLEYKYGMSFQNYINMLRIRYAEQYLLRHDDSTQKEIALACGFSGASSFNSAFSKQNGVTPKIWKDRQLESLKSREA